MTRLMHGCPVPADQQVHLGNWRTGPWNRWSFQHVRELVPSADIACNCDYHRPLGDAAVDFSALPIALANSTVSLQQYLFDASVDGVVALHNGDVVFECYAHGMTQNTPHILMSVSKSVLGVLAGILQHQGVLDVDTLVTEVIPELSNTAYAGATLRNLLDMRVGIEFDEDYLATGGTIIEYRKATCWNPLEPGDTPSDLRSFYQLLIDRDGYHGDHFHYVSPNTDLLAWVLERLSGQRYADLLSQQLWQKMGADHPAYITVDRLGAPRAAGGVCTSLRDLARLGQCIADNGRCNGEQIIPRQWIEDTETAGDSDAWNRGSFAAEFPNMSMNYRNQWYVAEQDSPWLFCIGVFGQNLYINRRDNFVLAKFSSSSDPLDSFALADGFRLAAAMHETLVS